MEAVVVKTTGNVTDAHLQAELAEVNNHLVSAHAVLVGVKNLVVLLQAGAQIVGVEDGVFGSLCQAVAAQHEQIAVADGEEQCVAVRCGSHGVALLASHFDLTVLGQEVKQFGTDSDRTDTGTATAVRTCKGFVQVQVAHIGTHVSRAGDANLGVHVGTIHIDKTTGTVDDVHNLQNALFEGTMSGRIGNHDASKVVLVLLNLGFEVVDVHIAAVVAFHHHNSHAGFGSTGGIGAMGTGRNQTDIAVGLSLVDMIVADDSKSAVFTCGAGIGLQRHTCEAGNNSQQIFHLVNKLVPTLGLVSGGEWVHATKFAPAQRQHLSGSVQFHGAAAQRNHGTVQTEVFHLQFLHIAHHLCLAVVFVKHTMSQIRCSTHQVLRQRHNAGAAAALAFKQFRLLASGSSQNGDNLVHVIAAGGLIDADADALFANIAEVDMMLQSNFLHLLGLHRTLQCEGVEESTVVLFVAVFFQFFGQHGGNAMDIASDIADAFGTMPCGIETAHDGLQSRGSADVRSSLVSLDVLFAHTQSHTQSGVALHINAPSNNTAGESTFKSISDGEETCVRTTEAHGQTKTLVATKSAIGTHLTGSLHHSQSHQVGSHTDKDTLLVTFGNKLGIVAHLAKLVGVLHNNTEIFCSVKIEILHIAGHNLNVAGSGIGVHHIESLRQNAVVDENLVHTVFLSLTAAAGKEHQHALATGRGLVQQAGVGHGHVSHVGHHGLISH